MWGYLILIDVCIWTFIITFIISNNQSVKIAVTTTYSVLFLFLFLLSMALSLGARHEVATYKNNYAMIQEVISSGELYDNIAVSQTIIEYNSWLSKANADKQTYGIFSMYGWEDLDSLEYIKR